MRATFILCGLALAACGSVEKMFAPDSSTPPDAGTSQFSCTTTNSSGLRTCSDYFFSGTPPSSLSAECAMKNGTAGSACDHAHTSGGCLFTMTIDGVEVSYVYWYFYDSPEDVMAACAQAKVPYVAP